MDIYYPWTCNKYMETVDTMKSLRDFIAKICIHRPSVFPTSLKILMAQWIL